MTLFTNLLNDEAGFIVSAELVLVSTIAVLGMIVGLSEVSHNVNNELEDVGSAFASLNQSYKVHCSSGHKGDTAGSRYQDSAEFCDGQFDVY
ncbi:branched-chain amino acid aminotransferase [Planctomicrobium sp. SH664]|uniref:branched-chain amino acid aminotransferase n=1 Tax=Planctomicrobium sp. SH664 TaxID=3448125 RepID=UPI003F5B85CC